MKGFIIILLQAFVLIAQAQQEKNAKNELNQTYTSILKKAKAQNWAYQVIPAHFENGYRVDKAMTAYTKKYKIVYYFDERNICESVTVKGGNYYDCEEYHNYLRTEYGEPDESYTWTTSVNGHKVQCTLMSDLVTFIWTR